MKTLLLSLLLSASVFAQDPFQLEAVLSKPDGDTFRAWVLAATKTGIRYKTTPTSTSFTDAKISDFSTIYIMDPSDFSAAMDLLEGRKYKEAQDAFAAVKERCTPLKTFRDNYHTLAAYYEMECMRIQGDYKGLAAALKTFIKEPLTRDDQLRQLDLYILWDAVRSLAWDRVVLIAAERDDETLPGYQRAQVAYCKALGLEKLERNAEALIEYNVAMTADSGASELITRQSSLNCLGIYFRDEQIQTAIRNWGTEDENKNSPGYTRLLEAAALAKFHQTYLSLGEPLPADLKSFIKYAAK